MSNNLKEEINDLIGECIMRALEDNGETVNGLKTIQLETTEAILALINQKEKELLKEGFYGGQANAGVNLEQCHKNWARWNLPKEEKDRIKQLKEELNKEVV